MRKINILRAVLSVATAMLLTVGVFGQNPPVPYTQYDANLAAPTNVDYVTLKAGGTAMGYYALPDPVYHPNYVGAGTLTAGFWWNWTNPTFPVGNQATVAKPGAANYARITYPAVGNYVIRMAEHAPATFGGCVGIDSTLMNVTVVLPPSAGFTTVDITNFCGDQVIGEAINMAITENVPVGFASYAFRIVLVQDNINVLGVRTALIDSSLVAGRDYTLAAKGKVGVTAGFTGAQPDYDYDFTSVIPTVQNTARTRYTYHVLPATGVTGNGIVSAISQKSDYLAAPTVNSYAFTDSQVVFIVNPAPTTGPIYYVPNNYNY
jgi:hypothetical protein